MLGSRYNVRVRLTVALLLLMCSLLLLPVSADQSGFVSIDCGSTSNYTDSTTGLLWSTDEGYISTGVNANVTVRQETSISRQLSTARYFRRRRAKHCYALPVQSNSSYLIRSYFLFGDLEASPPSDYFFNVSIDSTIVGGIDSTDDAGLFAEFLVASAPSSREIAFCIIPGIGNPYISSLELRPLAPGMYMDVMFTSKYIRTLFRLDSGAASTNPDVRYPDDAYDRKWSPPGSSFTVTSTNTTRAIDLVAFDKPPVKVLQSAWEGAFFWIYFPTDVAQFFYVGFSFAEIDGRKSLNRTVNITVNGENWYKDYAITSFGTELYNEMEQIQGGANFTFAATPDSPLPALLNAVEFHAVYEVSTTVTASSDVLALSGLRKSLNLLDWTGDPCQPVAWDWLNCSADDPSEVTQLKLSGYRLAGTIPENVSNLGALTDLWLDNNLITGSIPNLAALRNLKTLHLQNNSLTGNIPASLADIPNLSELFLEDNQLNGPIPAALLNKNGLLLRADNMTAGGNRKKKSGSSGAVIGGVVAAIIIAALLAALIFCCIWRRRKNKPKVHQPDSYATPNTGAHGDYPHGAAAGQMKFTRQFSHEEVVKATNNFKSKIGEGGFGPVYYGELASGEVAVKRNSASSTQGAHEFFTEVNLLSRVHHRNLVSLVGYSISGDEQILIYEYMHQGTLREHLYGKGLTKVMGWRTRLDAAVNAARGLEYLHYDCTPKIIHRDVKSNNILLNENLLAKVADFGISRQIIDDNTTTGVSTVVRGTAGYLDPEYFVTNKLTYKSDVFAFGVVLLEIIAGRPPNDTNLADISQSNLVEYARRIMRDGNLEAIVDPSLGNNYNVEAMWKLAELAMYCVEPQSRNRPDMRKVVREVTEAISLEYTQDVAQTDSFAGNPGFIFPFGDRDPEATSTFADSTTQSSGNLPQHDRAHKRIFDFQPVAR